MKSSSLQCWRQSRLPLFTPSQHYPKFFKRSRIISSSNHHHSTNGWQLSASCCINLPGCSVESVQTPNSWMALFHSMCLFVFADALEWEQTADKMFQEEVQTHTRTHMQTHSYIPRRLYQTQKKSFSLALRITSDSLSHEISALAKAVGTKKRWRQKHIGYALTPRRSCTLLRVGLTNSDLAWDVSLSLRLYQFIVRLVPGELSTIKGADVKQWSFSSLA